MKTSSPTEDEPSARMTFSASSARETPGRDPARPQATNFPRFPCSGRLPLGKTHAGFSKPARRNATKA
jgi:hypothetical protein